MAVKIFTLNNSVSMRGGNTVNQYSSGLYCRTPNLV